VQQYQYHADWGIHAPGASPLLQRYCLAFEVEKLLATPSCTSNLSLLKPMVEIFSTALAYFDFLAGAYMKFYI
jgi:hypothetical protein